jgi:hypothetical protein
MKQKKIEMAKRPRGRPKTNRETRRFTLVLDLSVYGRIEQFALANRITHGEVIRRVLERGLPK